MTPPRLTFPVYAHCLADDLDAGFRPPEAQPILSSYRHGEPDEVPLWGTQELAQKYMDDSMGKGVARVVSIDSPEVLAVWLEPYPHNGAPRVRFNDVHGGEPEWRCEIETLLAELKAAGDGCPATGQ